MSVTYEWQFGVFETAPVEGELAQVVKVIHWRLVAADGDVRTSCYGTVNLAPPDADAFVAFEDLTKSWAIERVSEVVDVPALEASLAGEIQAIKNPAVVSLPAPFQN
jgi:hypothetical protein